MKCHGVKFLSRGLLLGEGKEHIIYPYYLSKVGVQGQDFSRWGGGGGYNLKR